MVVLKCPLCHARFDSDGPKAECPDCGEVFFPAGEPPAEAHAEEGVLSEGPEPEQEHEVPEHDKAPKDGPSTLERMLSRVPKPPAKVGPGDGAGPERPAAPVVAARGRPPAKRPEHPPAERKPDLAYIPIEFRVPRGFKPPAPKAPEPRRRKVVKRKRRRPAPPARGPVRPVRKVRPRRVKRVARKRPKEEPEPRGGVRPITRRTSEKQVWRTRSGIAGILLVIVFVLALAQAMLMLSMDDGPGEGGGRADVLGTVLDTSGSKVVGADVTLDGGRTVTTDGSGSFFFESVSTGDHTLTVEAQGYATSTWRTTISGSNRYVTVTVGDEERTVDDTTDLERRDSTVPFIALFFVVCGGVAFVGGVTAIRGLGRTIPMIGAVAGMVSLGLYVGTALSFVALLLLFLSEEEFADVHRCAACTGVIGGVRSTCHHCGAEYHPACSKAEGECVVCGSSLR